MFKESPQKREGALVGRLLDRVTTSLTRVTLQSGFTSIFTFFTTSAFGMVNSSIPFLR